MSEQDNSPMRHGFEADFIDIIDATEARDAGIVSFEQKMSEFREELLAKYRGKSLQDHTGVLAVEDELNDLWAHEESTALVTGRVFIDDPGIVDEVPAEWGDTQTDTQNNDFYFVENFPLMSHGVRVNLFYDDNKDMTVSDVKIGFAFALTSDQDEMPAFMTYPGELFRHEYDKPTAEEAELRLQRNWPKEYTLLRQLVTPNSSDGVPRRIALMQRRLQDLLVQDENFRGLLETYLDENMALSLQFPYIATVQNTLLCYEGQDNPFQPDAQGTWTKVLLKDELATMVYEPTVRVFMHEDGSASLDIIVAAYNDQDEEPEYLRFPSENLISLRSTRAQRAILDMVMTLTAEATFDTEGSEQLKDFAKKVQAGIIEGELVPDDTPAIEISEYMQEMMMLRDGLKTVREIVIEAQKTLYDTPEDAYHATIELIKSNISPILSGAGIFNQNRLQVSGPGVLGAEQLKDENETGSLPHVMFHAINPERGLAPIEIGDTLEGSVESIGAMARVVKIDEETERYAINPALVIQLEPQSKSLLTFQGVAVVETRVTTRSFVTLDDQTDIAVKQLEAYDQSGLKLDTAYKSYGKHPLIDNLEKMRNEFAQEVQSSLLPMKNSTLFVDINNQLRQAIDQGFKRGDVIEVLESLLFDRVASVEAGSEQTVVGKVIDVEFDEVNDDLKLAVQVSETLIMHIRFADISGFSF